MISTELFIGSVVQIQLSSVVAMRNISEAGDHLAAQDQVLVSQVVAAAWKTLF